MKRILGLDLGTTSIGWALVNEAENKDEISEIIKLGVRIIQYDSFSKVDKFGNVSESKNPADDFASGKGLSPNAKRTRQRGARRSLQRFKQRRKNLIEVLKDNGFISSSNALAESGKGSTFETLEFRAKAAVERVEKNELARVFLAINKKRGYKSSRKAKNEEEGSLIDGMGVAKEMYENKLTVGQYVSKLLKGGGKYIPDFYRSDLRNEFDLIWNHQQNYNKEKLTAKLYDDLLGKNKTQTWAICKEPFELVGIKRNAKGAEMKAENYEWRELALTQQLNLETLAIVFQEINNDLNKSSGYLGAMSDRSKELYFNKETVGQNLYKQLQGNPNTSLKNQVFYRQDYMDEFEKIWEIQSAFHKELTAELKMEIRDIVIFYQRKLKSQKHLISECEFEKHHKVIPKSSPLFQEFKIRQMLNILEFKDTKTGDLKVLTEDDRELLFEELNARGKLSINEIINFLGLDKKRWETNFKEGLEGNNTNAALFKAYQKIAEYEGYGFDWNKKSASEIKEEVKVVLSQIGVSAMILECNTDLVGEDFEKQESYMFWHLLYSSEEDESLKNKLQVKFGFMPEYTGIIANVALQPDYGSLSSRAIKKILPFLKAGNEFSKACELAGYNHSSSLTKEELAKRPLKDKLELLKKNSLRNPVVEKILNQMVNLVNQAIDEYGKPDEIRIELARELKKSAKERAEMTTNINAAKTKYEGIRKVLMSEFGVPNPTRNDIIRYRLYEELKPNGYHSLYTNKYIPKEKLFSPEIEIEHIIPKSRLYDDSFSNKTLAYSKPNKDKGDRTAFDFISIVYSSDLKDYENRVDLLFNKGAGTIGKAKREKLMMGGGDIPSDFIKRDLRDSQYIAKKAKLILEEVARTVNTTTGIITAQLREDWDLINVMQELNLPKYKAIDESLVEQIEKKDGTFKTRIKNWSKRNDHRHHAMDALTVAFTTYSHVQYVNNLNASRNEENKVLYGIRNKITKVYESKNGSKKRKFVPPIPNFREVSKRHIESILISFKAKNKVVTKNINKTKVKGKDKYLIKVQLTPRGQLHKETIYGQYAYPVIKEEKVGKNFDLDKINTVTKPKYREALLTRLHEYNGDAAKAFTGKNGLIKNPLCLSEKVDDVVPEKVKTLCYESSYSIRKAIGPDLKIDKVLDEGIKRILQNRLDEFKGNPKEAFSNLEAKPIWLNEDKNIAIKRVRISGVSNAEVLHTKRDHFGNEILIDGVAQPSDFVSTGNNHHVAIYIDEDGKLHDKVVSLYEAVAKVTEGLAIIDKEFNKEQGWKLLFTMKQNEMFVFPSEDFNPKEIDLRDVNNSEIVSKHLFRVQKFSKVEYGNSAVRDYVFRHHLETQLIDNKILRDTTFIVCKSLPYFNEIVKVRIDHIGKIVQVGEY